MRKSWFAHMKRRASDMFKCSGCGRVVRMRVLGDTCVCRECGATMHRICALCVCPLRVYDRTEQNQAGGAAALRLPSCLIWEVFFILRGPVFLARRGKSAVR